MRPVDTKKQHVLSFQYDAGSLSHRETRGWLNAEVERIEC